MNNLNIAISCQLWSGSEEKPYRVTWLARGILPGLRLSPTRRLRLCRPSESHNRYSEQYIASPLLLYWLLCLQRFHNKPTVVSVLSGEMDSSQMSEWTISKDEASSPPSFSKDTGIKKPSYTTLCCTTHQRDLLLNTNKMAQHTYSILVPSVAGK